MRFRPAFPAVLFCGCLALAACGPPKPAGKPGAQAQVQHGVDLAGMDRGVQPGGDFFQFTNGRWVDIAQIPPDRGSWGVFSILADKASKRTSDLIRDLAKANPQAGSDAQKIGDYFASFMDEAAIERNGLAPLQPRLQRIAALSDVPSLSHELGLELRNDVDALNNTNFHTPHLFGLWVAPDFNRPDRYAPYLFQGGLGLPERNYYLDASPKMAEIRSRYLAHIAAMLKLAGATDADALVEAKGIMALETQIARAHWSAVDSRDVVKANNPRTRDELQSQAPGMDWTSFLQAAGLDRQTDFIAWQPSSIAGLSGLVASEPLKVWKDYLAFHAIEEAAPLLSKGLVDENFAFNGKVLSGVPELSPRWKRAVNQTNNALGFAVGRLYVQRYFQPDAKAKAQAMVTNILAAYRTRLQQLTWMSPQTKAKALQKLSTLWVGVGYPDKWRDYSALQVVRGDPYGNWERAEAFETQRNIRKLGQPVDRMEWSMTPQTVNAVNLPIQNGLNFPAAILDAPFFDPVADPVVNYGAIGSVIGHEISHSFDNQGAQFDALGRLSMWWTPADFAHFTQASQKLTVQYDGYRAFPDLHVNGKLTLGENIADVAGLVAAYDGWKLSLKGAAPKSGPNGFTADQQYFIAYGQAHRAKFREAALRRQILTNEHAPDPYRADTVRNLEAWYSAFGVQPGQKLYLKPEDRVRIW